MSSSSETSSFTASVSRGAAAHGRRSSINIRINGHYTSKVYSSGSIIAGDVVVAPSRDTRFDYVQIILLGTSRTRLDALQVPTQSSHTFLKLEMPIPESTYPTPRVFESGRSYTIPFNFVVPSHLTMSACNHHAANDTVPDQHMRLPPTMGFWDRDDLAPEMAKVEYAVKARVLALPDLDGPARPDKLMEAHCLVRVLPSSVEDPPLNLTKHDRAYCLTKSKSLRKNLFSAKTGRLTASAAQPAAVILGSDGRSASGTSATVQLAFEPAGADVCPPKISAVSAKLTATTYFSASPMTRLPDLGSGKYDFSNAQMLSYSTSVALFSTSVDKVTWRSQITAQARRDSGYASESAPSDTEATTPATVAEVRPLRGSKSRSTGPPLVHTAALAIPFRVPASRKLFLPTFHSCLVSRVYVLHLTLAVGGASGTTLSLALPLQVVVDAPTGGAGYDDMMALPSFDSVMAQREEEEADEHLRPRMLSLPDVEAVPRGRVDRVRLGAGAASAGVLPGYDDLVAPRRRSVRV